MCRLGIEPLDQARRVDEIGEQHGHRASGRQRDRFRDRRGRERRIVPQDRLLQLPERRPGLEPELLVQHAPGRLVGLERLGLAPAAVEREHQLAAEPLVEWVLLDQRLELGREIGVAAQLQLGVEQVLRRGEPQLLEAADLDGGERLVDQVAERRPAPKAERLAELLGTRLRRVARARLGAEPLEPRASTCSGGMSSR